MEHLVRFTTTEGRDASHVTGSLDDAVRFVERLRNNEEASVVRVFRLQEVPISFKTYYKVELGTAEAAEERAEAPAERTPAQPAAAAAAPAPPSPAEGDASRKLFSRA